MPIDQSAKTVAQRSDHHLVGVSHDVSGSKRTRVLVPLNEQINRSKLQASSLRLLTSTSFSHLWLI